LRKFEKPIKKTPKKGGKNNEDDDSDDYEEEVREPTTIQGLETPTLPSMTDSVMTPTTRDAVNKMIFNQGMKVVQKPVVLQPTPQGKNVPIAKRTGDLPTPPGKKTKTGNLSIEIPSHSNTPFVPTQVPTLKSTGSSQNLKSEAIQALTTMGSTSLGSWTPNTIGLSPTPTGTFSMMTGGGPIDYPSPKSETTQ
jgi:hypothetical protein